ncbi:hypothetical protein D918_08112 [Trichuris suis]|nr:hypothetical protein D918_08112 [Trichuris suis]
MALSFSSCTCCLLLLFVAASASGNSTRQYLSWEKFLERYPELTEYDRESLREIYERGLLSLLVQGLKLPEKVQPASLNGTTRKGGIDKLEGKEEKKSNSEDENSVSSRTAAMFVGASVAATLLVVLLIAAMGYKYRKKIFKQRNVCRKSSALSAPASNVRTKSNEPVSPKPERQQV